MILIFLGMLILNDWFLGGGEGFFLKNSPVFIKLEKKYFVDISLLGFDIFEISISQFSSGGGGGG